MKSISLIQISLYLLVFAFGSTSSAQELYNMPEEKVETKWTSFENPYAEKGAGAKENQGAKGHAFDRIPGGESIDLVSIKGSGVINRIWLTIDDRSPEVLRSLRIEMFWDGEDKSAVSVPLGDFFGIGLGRKVAFESELFSDPEGRSFNCFIPMPFKTAARVTITNDRPEDSKPITIFYDLNLVNKDHGDNEMLYFHAFWNRDIKTPLKQDFSILPEVEGKGRFLGTNIGIITDEKYEDTWWGEGEVKIYLDGDSEYPSLAGSGTEDYVGTAYGQGTYDHMYQGSLIADQENGLFAFYRYHIPDPVYFYEDIKVDIQQIGGAPTERVRKIVENGAELIPITVDHFPEFTKLLEEPDAPELNDPDFPKGWTNFYRSDDVSATAYFYLDKPSNELPSLPELKKRTENLIGNK